MMPGPNPDSGSRTAWAHGLAMSLVLLLVAFYGSLFGETIPIRDGRGWDGDIYVSAAADLGAGWEITRTNPYLFQRLAPSLLVHAGLVLTGAPRDDATVIGAFKLLNISLLLLTLWLWLKTSDVFGLSIKARWMGFLGLFVNVQCFKIAYYYAPLTDIPALALGMALVYLSLTGRTLALAAVTLVGAFTWPASGLMGAALILFPPPTEPDWKAPPTPVSIPALTLAALTALGVTAMTSFHYYIKNVRTAGWGPVVPAVESVYPLSLLVTAAYVLIVVVTCLPEPTPAGLRDLWRRLRPANVALTLLVLLLPRLVVSALTSGVEWVTVENFIPYTFFLSTTRPGIFLVAHVVFFGPILLLLPYVWRQFRAILQQWGAGAQLYTILGLMVAACPDSRMSTLVLPIVIVLLVVGCERVKWLSNGLLFSMGALALAMSRIWQPFNIRAVGPGTEPLAPGWDMSRYYETQGSYMTEPHYLSALTIAALVLFLLSFSVPQAGARRAEGAKGAVKGR